MLALAIGNDHLLVVLCCSRLWSRLLLRSCNSLLKSGTRTWWGYMGWNLTKQLQ
jgi:hypothetical protein